MGASHDNETLKAMDEVLNLHSKLIDVSFSSWKN